MDKFVLNETQAVQLVSKLCSDDSFREQFTLDPAAAFKSINIDCGNKALACASPSKLASKEEFTQIKDSLIEYLTGKGVNTSPPPMDDAVAFEAGQSSLYLK